MAASLGAEVEFSDYILDATTSHPPGPGSGAPASERASAALFGEGSGGFVVSGSAKALGELGESVPIHRLGTVGGERLTITRTPAPAITIPLGALTDAHNGLAELFS
jgi:hypothetical protein